jgi:hypothetical protein
MLIYVPLLPRTTHALLLVSKQLNSMLETMWKRKLSYRLDGEYDNAKAVYVRYRDAGSPNVFFHRPFSPVPGISWLTSKRDVTKLDCCLVYLSWWAVYIDVRHCCYVGNSDQEKFLAKGVVDCRIELVSGFCSVFILTSRGKLSLLMLSMEMRVLRKIHISERVDRIVSSSVSSCTFTSTGEVKMAVVAPRGVCTTAVSNISSLVDAYTLLNNGDLVCGDGVVATDVICVMDNYKEKATVCFITYVPK